MVMFRRVMSILFTLLTFAAVVSIAWVGFDIMKQDTEVGFLLILLATIGSVVAGQFNTNRRVAKLETDNEMMARHIVALVDRGHDLTELECQMVDLERELTEYKGEMRVKLRNMKNKNEFE